MDNAGLLLHHGGINSVCPDSHTKPDYLGCRMRLPMMKREQVEFRNWWAEPEDNNCLGFQFVQESRDAKGASCDQSSNPN
jgi:hypothetical protein